MREVAETTGLNHIVEHLDVGEVLLTIEGRSSEAFSTQHHLVFLQISLLQHHLRTVRECQLRIAEEVVLLFLHDRALLRQSGHQRFVLHIVHVSLNLCTAGIGDSRLQALLRGVGGTIFLGIDTEHHKVGVVGEHELLDHGVDGIDGNHRNELLHRSISIVDAGKGLVVQEVLDTLVHKLAVVALVLV